MSIAGSFQGREERLVSPDPVAVAVSAKMISTHGYVRPWICAVGAADVRARPTHSSPRVCLRRAVSLPSRSSLSARCPSSCMASSNPPHARGTHAHKKHGRPCTHEPLRHTARTHTHGARPVARTKKRARSQRARDTHERPLPHRSPSSQQGTASTPSTKKISLRRVGQPTNISRLSGDLPQQKAAHAGAMVIRGGGWGGGGRRGGGREGGGGAAPGTRRARRPRRRRRCKGGHTRGVLRGGRGAREVAAATGSESTGSRICYPQPFWWGSRDE